jgi:hypothetical protein
MCISLLWLEGCNSSTTTCFDRYLEGVLYRMLRLLFTAIEFILALLILAIAVDMWNLWIEDWILNKLKDWFDK